MIQSSPPARPRGDVVTAAFASFEDPGKSAVVGKLETVPLPRARKRQRRGHRHTAAGIPKNLPERAEESRIGILRVFRHLRCAARFARQRPPEPRDVFTSELAKERVTADAGLSRAERSRSRSWAMRGAQVEQISDCGSTRR